MKRGSQFVALSRGKTYDLPSPLKVSDGKLFAGAGGRCYRAGAAAAGHVPWGLENAIITPRVATQGVLGGPLRENVHKENIARFAVRECSINIVDMCKEH